MRRIPANIHPFLFAIFPILALRNYNIIYVDFASIARSLILSLVLTGLLWSLLKAVIRDGDKAGLITTLAVILFFSYGHAYLQIELASEEAIQHRYLLAIFGIVFVILSAVILRLRDIFGIKQFVTVVGAVMIVFAVVQSVSYDISRYQANAQATGGLEPIAKPNHTKSEMELPDVYLIILDAHTRSDVLKENYDYDNSEFIQGLKEMGFYVAECSQSNYPVTRYSLTSLLYADYLQNFTDMPAMPDMGGSTIHQALQSLGYTTVAFENRTSGHYDLNEDIRLSRNQLAFGVDLGGGPNEFEAELFQTTFLKFFYDLPQLIPGFDPDRLEQTEYREHFLQMHYILDELDQVPAMEGPKFVFVHILVPHPPFIFSPNGEFHPTGDQISGYRDNVQFVESQILPSLKEIIAQSKVPPIIIVQGDHGPIGKKVTREMRMSILNAYYVNEETKASLYGTITPVNSFRVILDHYFGYDLPLLEDSSYYVLGSTELTPDSIVPNNCTK